MKLPWKWSLVKPTMFHLKLMRCLPNPAHGLGVRSGINHGRYKEKVNRDREGKTRRISLVSHGISWHLIQDHTWLCCFDRKAVVPPASPEHPGLHLGSLSLKAELLRPLQGILKPESLSFNKISSLLITTTFVCLERWTGGESILQAVKCSDECGIKIWTDWNKEEPSWYSEKQYNTFVLNLLKLILAKLCSSPEPTY